MNQILASVDNPFEGTDCFGTLDVRGWAVSLRGRIVSVDVFFGERHLGTVPYGFPRRDVVEVIAEAADEFCGFDGRVSIEGIGLGRTQPPRPQPVPQFEARPVRYLQDLIVS